MDAKPLGKSEPFEVASHRAGTPNRAGRRGMMLTQENRPSSTGC